MRSKHSPEDSFWAKVTKETEQPIPHLKTPCWIWTGAKTKEDYGYFRPAKTRARVHRFSWELHNGPIPIKMIICHRCDRPACVNPSHLFLGTDATNAADRDNKGRQARGIRSGRAKLTEDQVYEIRYLHSKGNITYIELGTLFNVTESTVRSIVLRRTWKHLPPISLSPSLKATHLARKIRAQSVFKTAKSFRDYWS